MAQPLAIALAGLLSLAVAMGIGRFAFTPLLPMMLQDGVVSLPQASALATANYLGYWLGAMACALQPWAWRRWGIAAPVAHTQVVRAGLVATLLLTLAMALPWAPAWVVWRFLAGVVSALVFVYLSGWCLARLTQLGAPALAGLIFVGPGLGISVSGLAASAMVAGGWRAQSGWLAFGGLAAVLMAVAWPRLKGAVLLPVAPAVGSAQAADEPRAQGAGARAPLAWFALAYATAGFGYIVTATFLPVIARQALPGSAWLDLFWPLFGAAVALGALLTLRLPVQWDRRHLLCAAHAVQAVGVGLTVWWPSVAGFALGSLLLGLPFTAITLFAMQEARRLRPHNPSALIGLLTAAYGLGQIAGPPMAAWWLRHGEPVQAFAHALQTATLALAVGGCIYAALAWRHPVVRH
jgi:MFS family permease